MSLVHDALQKAAREKQRKDGVYVPPPPPSVAPQPVAKSVESPAPPQAAKSQFALFSAVVVSVAVVAIVAIVFLVMRNERPARQQTREPAPAAVVAPAPTPTPARTETAAPVIPAPPRPAPATASTPVTPPKLSGISGDPDGRLCAILDGRIVYEGYVINDATVKRIERNRVVLEVGGQETVLRLF